VSESAIDFLESRATAVFEPRHRLLKGSEFKAVFDCRKRFHCTFFSFHLMPNQADCHRLGLAVSRKVSKKAVDRNRIKRQVRESFRHFIGINQQTALFLDIVVVAKPAAASVVKSLLRAELDGAWPRAMAMAGGLAQTTRKQVVR